MFGRVAARSAAVLLVVSAFVGGGSATAFAQYQINVSALSPTEPLNQTLPPSEPFGLAAIPVTNGQVVTKWNGLVADISAEKNLLQRCRDDAQPCPPAAQKFLAVVADGRAHEGRARIGVINRAINLAIRPTSDFAQWGVPDRWSAPLATLASGRGDCEDYAIAKYVALREAGISERDVRLVIVHDLANGEDHAVTAVRFDEKWMMLDNRRLALVEDVDMPRVVPLFVLDADGVKQFAPAIAQGHPAPADSAATAPSADRTATAPSALGL